MATSFNWHPIHRGDPAKAAIIGATIHAVSTEQSADIMSAVEWVEQKSDPSRFLVKLQENNDIGTYDSNIFYKISLLAISEEDEDASVVQLTFYRYTPATCPIGYMIGRPLITTIPIDYDIAMSIYNQSQQEGEEHAK